MKSPTREKNSMGMTIHQMCYLALFLAVVGVILGGMGTKAYYDIEHNPNESQEVGNLTVNGHLSAKILAWQTGLYDGVEGLTKRTLTDAQVDAGFTGRQNEVVIGTWTADAASAVALPKAQKGVLFMYRNNAAGDGTGAMTFTRNGNDTFDTTYPLAFMSIDDGGAAAYGEYDLATSADTTVVATTAANGVWGGAGSVIAFYAVRDGVWAVNVPIAIATGTGAGGSVVFG